MVFNAALIVKYKPLNALMDVCKWARLVMCVAILNIFYLFKIICINFNTATLNCKGWYQMTSLEGGFGCAKVSVMAMPCHSL